MNIAGIAIDTSGLDYNEYELLNISIVTDQESHLFKVRYDYPIKYDDVSIAKNNVNINELDTSDRQSPEDIQRVFHATFSDILLVGFNIGSFTIPFLEKVIGREIIRYCFGYQYIELNSILYYEAMRNNISYDILRYGISQEANEEIVKRFQRKIPYKCMHSAIIALTTFNTLIKQGEEAHV